MNVLVIGSDGFIGKHLHECIPCCGHTSVGMGKKEYDLRKPTELPHADVAYLCAGVNGFEKCEGSRDAWKSNVDGTITTIKNLLNDGTFPVFLSSDSVCWSASQYSRMKAQVEAYMLHSGGAIVRCGRVTQANIGDLIRFLLKVSNEKTHGLTEWQC